MNRLSPRSGQTTRPRRFRAYFLAFFACLVGLTPLTPVAAVTDPGGGTPAVPAYIYTEMDPDKLALSYSIYYGVVKCLTGEESIPNDDVINGSIEGASNSYTHSYYVDKVYGDGKDGKIGCETAIKTAVSLWEYGDVSTALTDWGYKNPGNGGDWKNSSPGANTAAAIRNRVYANKDPVISSAARYVNYFMAFQQQCQPTGKTEYAKASAALKSAADKTSGATEYVKIKEPAPDYKSVIEYIYKVDDQRTNLTWPVNSPLGESIGFTDCRGLANLISSDAEGYRFWADNNPDKAAALTGTLTGGTTSTGGGGTPTCTITGIGWLLCPVLNFLARIADQAYGVVANMLTIPSVNTSDTSSALYQAWSAVRNAANVCFVIAFLLIIYSQLTSAGISNYGIKKMLPKLIISAVLVNVSFWLCALAVDVSNFLGYGISNMFKTIGQPLAGGDQTTLNSGNKLTNITVGILGTTAVATQFLSLAALLPLLIGAVLVIVTIVFVLTLRQGLIVILIVISPLAFVAYLLPNTSKLFDKWWDAFKVLLLMFPVVAFVYSGSAIAGKVLAGVADDMDGSLKIMFQIMATTLPILSFIAAYTLMKTSSMLIGRALNNNPAKGLSDRAKRGAENYGKMRDDQRAAYGMTRRGIRGRLVGGRAGRRALNKEKRDAAERNARLASADYVSDSVTSGGRSWTNRISGGRFGSENKLAAQLGRGLGQSGQASALANAIQVSAELEAKEVNAQRAIIKELNLSEEQKADLAAGRRVQASNGMVLDGRDREASALALRMAAQQSVVEGGDAGAINTVLNHMNTLSALSADGSKELNNFADALTKSSNKPAYVQAKDLSNMRQNGLQDKDDKTVTLGDADEIIRGAIHDNVYTADRMANTGRQEIGEVKRVAATLTTSTDRQDVDGLTRLMNNAADAIRDPRTSVRLGKQREHVENMSRGVF